MNILFLSIAQNLLHYAAHKPKEGMVEKYSKKAVEKAGQEGVKYIDKNGVPTEQQLDDAEAKAKQDYDNAKQQAEVCIFVYIGVYLGSPSAQGMWAKYCGCLSGIVA
jgi:hypothetical protein